MNSSQYSNYSLLDVGTQSNVDENSPIQPKCIQVPVADLIAPSIASAIDNLYDYITPDEFMKVRQVYTELQVESAAQPFEDDLQNVKLLAHHYINNTPSGQESNGFYVVDLGTIILQMAKWRKSLPMVRPFYAMKCNPNPAILKMLSALGAGFDCASQGELMTILDAGLADTDSIIFANPCKQISHMQYARRMGVQYLTFDNEAELQKIKKFWPDAKCVLRIATNDSKSVCQFSVKFGCPWSQYRRLVQVAHELELDLVGVSFHVGSGCGDANVHVESARVAREIFDFAEEQYGYKMNLLDIGGGFPGLDNVSLTFDEIATNLAPFLQENFSGCNIIAEPGRYFAEPVQSLVMNIFSKRVIPLQGEEQEVQYYVNDGVYHSFNCIIFDHVEPKVYPLVHNPSAPHLTTTMYGPTCDSMDCIFKRMPYPELEIGDWLVVPAFGAYTNAAGSAFNGFATTRFEYMTSVPVLEAEP